MIIKLRKESRDALAIDQFRNLYNTLNRHLQNEVDMDYRKLILKKQQEKTKGNLNKLKLFYIYIYIYMPKHKNHVEKKKRKI